LRRAAAAGLLAVPATGLLGACATGGGGDSNTGGGGTKTAANPLGVKEDAELEVVIFEGGYGQKYATDVHEPLYKNAFPKANIKAAGIVPFAYAGANATYYMWNVILTHAAKIGGESVLKSIDNLEPKAWQNESVKKAASMWAEVGAKYMDKSHEGLKHTDVQL